jgi:hypothetical protein
MSAFSVAGPIVQMIFVLRTRKAALALVAGSATTVLAKAAIYEAKDMFGRTPWLNGGRRGGQAREKSKA